MKILIKILCMLLIGTFFTNSPVFPQAHADIIVDQSGKGDYRTITAAIDALSMYPYQRTIIFIKNGIYEEKIRIEQHYITLRGENRDSTIIRYNQLREDWNKKRDYIGPAVINIDGDDLVLDNLTIENTQPQIGPHAFAIYGLTNNRTLIMNCKVISKGGDTVSLWNYKHGMYYHTNCFFQGAVDFVCPHGWCFIRDSQFYEVKKTAALWHAGVFSPDQKFVIRNSSFDGVPGFQLGRHHYEAQFYLLDCRFSENMADQPIYKVFDKNPDRNNPYFHGERKYFSGCNKEGGAFEWYQDNLDEALGQPKPAEITPAWTFNQQWDPESIAPIYITDYKIDSNRVVFHFNEIVTVRGEPEFTTQSGKTLKIVKQRFNDINKLIFSTTSPVQPADLSGELKMSTGDIIASVASVHERSLGKQIYIQRDAEE